MWQFYAELTNRTGPKWFSFPSKVRFSSNCDNKHSVINVKISAAMCYPGWNVVLYFVTWHNQVVHWQLPSMNSIEMVQNSYIIVEHSFHYKIMSLHFKTQDFIHKNKCRYVLSLLKFSIVTLHKQGVDFLFHSGWSWLWVSRAPVHPVG